MIKFHRNVLGTSCSVLNIERAVFGALKRVYKCMSFEEIERGRGESEIMRRVWSCFRVWRFMTWQKWRREKRGGILWLCRIG